MSGQRLSLKGSDRTFGAECRVGRLVEGWAARFDTVDDIDGFGRQVRVALDASRGPAIICMDFSALATVPPEVFVLFGEVLRRANERFERAAFTMPREYEGDALRRQLDGLMRKTAHPNRRLCVDFAEAWAWLGSVMSPVERVRFDTFVRERQAVEKLPSGSRRVAPKGGEEKQ